MGTSVKVGVCWGDPTAGLKQLTVRVRRVPAIEERSGKSRREGIWFVRFTPAIQSSFKRSFSQIAWVVFWLGSRIPVVSVLLCGRPRFTAGSSQPVQTKRLLPDYVRRGVVRVSDSLCSSFVKSPAGSQLRGTLFLLHAPLLCECRASVR